LQQQEVEKRAVDSNEQPPFFSIQGYFYYIKQRDQQQQQQGTQHKWQGQEDKQQQQEQQQRAGAAAGAGAALGQQAAVAATQLPQSLPCKEWAGAEQQQGASPVAQEREVCGEGDPASPSLYDLQPATCPAPPAGLLDGAQLPEVLSPVAGAAGVCCVCVGGGGIWAE
jgi:hypothetical protein